MLPRSRPHPGIAVTAGGTAFVLLAMVGTMVAFTALMLGVAMPIILVFAIVLLAQRRAYRRSRWRHYRAMTGHYHRGMHPQPVPPHLMYRYPVRPVAPARPQWRLARQRFDALRSEYARYECDPMLVLRLPALADVRVPSTARFVEAFAEAQALDTDAEPPQRHAASFVAAVDRACRAWRAAWDAAERIRLSGLSADERAAVDRVVKLLTMAKDTDSDSERLTAYAKARAELARLERSDAVRLPRPAQAHLEAASRGQLPARETA